MTHFKKVRKGIKATFSPAERVFLSDVLPLLAEVGQEADDPAASRLHVPVYLDDPEANDEWWRLMGKELDDARREDRAVYRKVIAADDGIVLDDEQANAFLRVLNEGRLVLGARMGVEVESDHYELSEHARQVLDYLGWVLEELTEILSRSL